MKKFSRILLIIFLILLLVVGVVLWWQWDNLQALYSASTLASEEIEQKLDSNEAELDELLKKMLPETNEPEISTESETLPAESEAATKNNSEQESSEVSASAPQQSQPEPAAKQEEPEASSTLETDLSAYDAEVAEILQKFYDLRDELLNKLDGIKSRAYQEYHSYSEAERETLDFAKMAAKYVKEATEMEKDCDKRMKTLLQQLRKVLKKQNKDPDLSGEIYEAYLKEKQLKKAWYMSELEKRGLVLS